MNGTDAGMTNWLAWLMDYVGTLADLPGDRLLAIFDGLHELFSQPSFAGWALINPVGLSGGVFPGVTERMRAQRAQLHDYVRVLAEGAGVPDPSELADEWSLLFDGVLVAAQRSQFSGPARLARAAAEQLLTAHLRLSTGNQ